MLATRPASSEGASEAQAEELSAAAPQEEKRIPGVKQDALKEERRPLLDLDDVEQLESELAACFDAPPPPPLNIDVDIQDIRREEATATVSEWTPAAEPRYLDTRCVAPHAPSLSTARRGGEQQQQQQQQATRVSDFSSLYSPPTNLAVSSSRQNLYPALVPTAPSADVARTNSRAGWVQPTTGQVDERGAASRASGATATAEEVASGITKCGGSVAAAEAREWGAAAAGASAAVAAVAAKAGDAPVQVVEELLSENERLRLIIQDMSEELDRVTFQLTRGAEAVVDEEPAATGEATQTLAQALARDPASRATESAASASATSALTRYPGAEAEARRRQREAGGQQSEQQQQQEQEQEQGTNQEQVLRRGIFVHFKCDNCPQWLKVPGHAQLVYCPTCSHTSQMTSGSTIHFPRNNQTPQTGGSESAAASSAAAADAGEDVGWLGYIKSVLAS